MEVVNPFILKNKERMVVFLDQLSNVPDPGNPPPNTNNNFDIGNKLIFFFLTFVVNCYAPPIVGPEWRNTPNMGGQPDI